MSRIARTIPALMTIVLVAGGCARSGSVADPTTPGSSASTRPTHSPKPAPSSSPSVTPSPSAAPQADDGRQFTFVTSMDLAASPPTVTYDLAYFYTGAAAVQAATEDGNYDPAAGIPNDYYVRNNNSQLRTVALAPDAKVRVYDWNHCCEYVNGYLPAFAAAIADKHPNGAYHGRNSPYWLRVRNGEVVKIQEQFLP